MLNKRIEYYTRCLGKSQGFQPLYIRDDIVNGYNFMTSCWEFTPEEIELVKMGASLNLSILGEKHPPISLFIGHPDIEHSKFSELTTRFLITTGGADHESELMTAACRSCNHRLIMRPTALNDYSWRERFWDQLKSHDCS